MQEFTLLVDEVLRIGEKVIIIHLPKEHPKAIPAQTVRMGITAPIDMNILTKV